MYLSQGFETLIASDLDSFENIKSTDDSLKKLPPKQGKDFHKPLKVSTGLESHPWLQLYVLFQ